MVSNVRHSRFTFPSETTLTVATTHRLVNVKASHALKHDIHIDPPILPASSAWDLKDENSSNQAPRALCSLAKVGVIEVPQVKL